MSMNVRINSDTKLQADVAVDDSDKTFTVPAGEEWEVQHIRAELTTTAVAGTRQMAIEMQDASSNVLARIQAGKTQIESLAVGYNFAPGLADQTTVVNGDLNTALPKLRLGPGEKLRVYDILAFAVSTDDLVVRIMVKTFKA